MRLDTSSYTKRAARERLARLVSIVVTSTAVGACISLFLSRLVSTVRYGEYAFTSGLEGAGILGVLKTCTGDNLYGNLAYDPNGYIFNYLFYLVYGSVTGFITSCREDAILVARMLSAITAVAASALVLWYASQLRVSTATSLLLATAGFSPLIGWWAFSVRPDIGGFFLALVAVCGLVFALTRNSIAWSVASIVASALSYGFKQPNLLLVVTTTLILLVNASDKQVRFVSAITGAAVLILIAASNVLWPEYYTHAFVIPSGHPLLMSVGVGNFISFVAKAFPYLVLLGLVVAVARGASWDRLEVSLGAAFLGLVAAFGAAASKAGASDNYYFPAFALCIALVPLYLRQQPALIVHIVTAVSAALLLISSVLVITGVNGRTALDPPDLEMRQRLIHYMKSAAWPRLIIGEPWALPTHSGPAEIRLLDEYVYTHGIAKQYKSIDLADLVQDNFFGAIFTRDLKLISGGRRHINGYCLKEQIGDMRVIARGPCDINVNP